MIITSRSLSALLKKTRQTLLSKGKVSKSQRGMTWSLNNVLLVWSSPSTDRKGYDFWPEKEDKWYQNNFVRKETAGLPEDPALKGEILFPYFYSHRSRYHDDGWGYLLGSVRAAKKIHIKKSEMIKDINSFKECLVSLSEYVHLQNLLSVLIWQGSGFFDYWFLNEKLLEETLTNTRFDTLERVVSEVRKNPLTRRAIIPSLMYTTDYLLDPMMGVPPYQNFQLLPSKENTPLSSSHWHRSLDASGGAQLDFHHDFDWLKFACRKTKRKMGSISIFAGNLHLYAATRKEARNKVMTNDNIQGRLKMWTDGYSAGEGIPKVLVKNSHYIKNIRKAYNAIKLG